MNTVVSCIYRVGARSVLPPNWQGTNLSLPDSKFYYVEKGEIVVEIGDQTLTAGPGDLLLIPAHTVHSCRLTETRYAEKAWCHFELKNGPSDFFSGYVVPPLLHVSDRAAVGRLFRMLFSSHQMPPAQKAMTSTAAICGLVQYYLDHARVTVRETVGDRIQRVVAYIEQHYTEPLTLEQLARLVNYSPTHLSKRFKAATGLSPIRYVNTVRIEQAKNLLQFSDEPIARVMEKSGFTDAAYFSRYFKKTLGCSPQDFRELSRPHPASRS